MFSRDSLSVLMKNVNLIRVSLWIDCKNSILDISNFFWRLWFFAWFTRSSRLVWPCSVCSLRLSIFFLVWFSGLLHRDSYSDNSFAFFSHWKLFFFLTFSLGWRSCSVKRPGKRKPQANEVLPSGEFFRSPISCSRFLAIDIPETFIYHLQAILADANVIAVLQQVCKGRIPLKYWIS